MLKTFFRNKKVEHQSKLAFPAESRQSQARGRGEGRGGGGREAEADQASQVTSRVRTSQQPRV